MKLTRGAVVVAFVVACGLFSDRIISLGMAYFTGYPIIANLLDPLQPASPSARHPRDARATGGPAPGRAEQSASDRPRRFWKKNSEQGRWQSQTSIDPWRVRVE